MIGIAKIACFVPESRIDNIEAAKRMGLSESFLKDKVGMRALARKPDDYETSDLCVHAIRNLADENLELGAVECLAVVTQNPDGHGLPHTAAIVHGKLGLSAGCAAFDISLGCSGYVSALSIVSGFMTANEMRMGLLVTGDPYSKIIDPDDKDTALIFGDAATATLLSDDPVWRLGRFDFLTDGSAHNVLAVKPNGKLHMNGRAVFSFTAIGVPKSVERTLKLNNITLDQVDRIVLHQGSKYVVDTIGRRLGCLEKTNFYADSYGNTVSSSVPIILAKNLDPKDRRVVISGFGVGLSLATTIIERD